MDSETGAMISHAAHFLCSCKKDVVNVAVREYIEAHRAEIQQAALDALRTLDGSRKNAVQLLAGASDEENAHDRSAPNEAEAGSQRLLAWVKTKDAETCLALGAEGFLDHNEIAILLDAVPGMAASDWQVEPGEVLRHEPHAVGTI